jgi:hypothetical protein
MPQWISSCGVRWRTCRQDAPPCQASQAVWPLRKPVDLVPSGASGGPLSSHRMSGLSPGISTTPGISHRLTRCTGETDANPSPGTDLTCLALATADHPLAKDDPSRRDQRSRYYPNSAGKSGDDCGIPHGLPHLGSTTTTLDRSLLNLGAYAALLPWSWRRILTVQPAVYKTGADSPRRAARCFPCSSGRMSRPASALQ